MSKRIGPGDRVELRTWLRKKLKCRKRESAIVIARTGNQLHFRQPLWGYYSWWIDRVRRVHRTKQRSKP